MHGRGGAAGGSSMTAVLVCDDAPDMRALLCDALQSDPGLHVVGEADDGAATLALAAELQPDVVLLDIGMPGPGPGEVVAGVRRAAPDAAIVVLSGYGPGASRRARRARGAHPPAEDDRPRVGPPDAARRRRRLSRPAYASSSRADVAPGSSTAEPSPLPSPSPSPESSPESSSRRSPRSSR